jgi:hypothetical protein
MSASLVTMSATFSYAVLPSLYRLITIHDTIALAPNLLLSFQSGCKSVTNTDMAKYKVTLNYHSGDKQIYKKKCAIIK